MIDMKIISGKEYENIKKKQEFIISFGFHESPFGKCLIGLFDDRICHFSFVCTNDSVNLGVLKTQWPGSTLINNEKLTAVIAKKMFDSEEYNFKVILKGTHFEGKVWKVLLGIPKGETLSYEAVARAAGHESAVRAAANAVAKNAVSYFIPCHRVIKKDGSLHKYQWGSDVKKKILLFEKYKC